MEDELRTARIPFWRMPNSSDMQRSVYLYDDFFNNKKVEGEEP
jgi:hypothetical protein